MHKMLVWTDIIFLMFPIVLVFLLLSLLVTLHGLEEYFWTPIYPVVALNKDFNVSQIVLFNSFS